MSRGETYSIELDGPDSPVRGAYEREGKLKASIERRSKDMVAAISKVLG